MSSLVEIRPIRPDDGERLQAAHLRLSPESRYRRFLSAKPILTADDARYLVQVDGSDHVALVATAPVGGIEEAIVAVARFVRLDDDPAAAEFAIVVADDYQRQGLATALLERLTAAAVAVGVDRFRATILSDNRAVRRLIAQLTDGDYDAVDGGVTTEVEFELPAVTAGRRDAMIAACGGS